MSEWHYQEGNKPRRVSVEAFPLKKSAEVLSAKENMRVFFGDTNGLHASLQDVRVSGDLLYAFGSRQTTSTPSIS